MIAAEDTTWSVVLLDIEGTTTPISFVHETLFPYARQRLGAFVTARFEDPVVGATVSRLRLEHATDMAAGTNPPSWPAGERVAPLVRYLEWLMDQDRKSPGLKALQGLIWEEGYSRGDLHGLVFDDVAPAMRTWHDTGKTIAIYSSGSVLAQRLLFQTTASGDLTTVINQFFDTSTGAKIERGSYERIARSLSVRAARILFISDVTPELAAARQAGCQVRLSLRPGNPPQPDADAYVAIKALSAV